MCEKELAFWQPRIDETRIKSLEEGKLEVVINMLQKEMDVELISELTGFNVNQILKTKETLLS